MVPVEVPVEAFDEVVESLVESAPPTPQVSGGQPYAATEQDAATVVESPMAIAATVRPIDPDRGIATVQCGQYAAFLKMWQPQEAHGTKEDMQRWSLRVGDASTRRLCSKT